MAPTTCIVRLVSTVSDCHKNALGRGSISSGHVTKLEKATFLYISMVKTVKLEQNLKIVLPCVAGAVIHQVSISQMTKRLISLISQSVYYVDRGIGWLLCFFCFFCRVAHPCCQLTPRGCHFCPARLALKMSLLCLHRE